MWRIVSSFISDEPPKPQPQAAVKAKLAPPPPPITEKQPKSNSNSRSSSVSDSLLRFIVSSKLATNVLSRRKVVNPPSATLPSPPPSSPTSASKPSSYFRAPFRALEISFTLAPLFILIPLSLLFPLNIGNYTWQYALQSLQSLGPAFIKLAQWAATRRDLFPKDVCDRLSTLHSTTRYHEWRHTHETLCKAFGPDYGSLIVINEQSKILGSGAVAQVYKATLNDESKRQVAIKVLHPQLKEMIASDLELMMFIANWIDRLPFLKLEWFALPEAVAEFQSVMEDQLDMRKEMTSLLRFRSNFNSDTSSSGGLFGSPIRVTFPKPIERLTTEDVLVESYEEGKQISEYFEADAPTRRSLAKPLITAFLKMVFTTNYIHCDLHPGNVLIRLDDKGKPSEIVLLDAGITCELAAQDELNLRDLFKAVVLNEGEKAGRLFVDRAKREKCSSIPGGVERFSKDLAVIISEFHDARKKGNLTLGTIKIGSLVGRVLELLRANQILLEPSMSNVVLSTIVLEGLGRTLDPDMNIMAAALPFIMGA
jgi:aarF domain-containing kinase